MTIKVVTFRWRTGTAIEWATKNPILDDGEPGREGNTGRFKIGDGLSSWNDLPYFISADEIVSLVEQTDAQQDGLGDLSQLSTNDKSSVVAAINEVNTPPVPLTTLYNNAKAG